MKLSWITQAVVLLCAAALCADAQVGGAPGSVPPRVPQPPPSPSFSDLEVSRRLGARFPGRRTPTMSGADRKRLEALREPREEDAQKYRKFLDRSGTGLQRLYPDADCVKKHIVRVDGECANYVMGASGLSFRGGSENYDLRFFDGQLVADGFFSLGMIVDLGDADLATVGAEAEGVRYLAGFQPAKSIDDARRQRAEIAAGLRVDEHFYSDRVPLAVDRTYAIRVVAFQAGTKNVWRMDRKKLPDQRVLARFAGLRWDERSDVVAAFRVIRKDDDGSITVLWRRLQKKDSPKLVFRKDQPLGDLKK